MNKEKVFEVSEKFISILLHHVENRSISPNEMRTALIETIIVSSVLTKNPREYLKEFCECLMHVEETNVIESLDKSFQKYIG